jgi:hypothetical protein
MKRHTTSWATVAVTILSLATCTSNCARGSANPAIKYTEFIRIIKTGRSLQNIRMTVWRSKWGTRSLVGDDITSIEPTDSTYGYMITQPGPFVDKEPKSESFTSLFGMLPTSDKVLNPSGHGMYYLGRRCELSEWIHQNGKLIFYLERWDAKISAFKVPMAYIEHGTDGVLIVERVTQVKIISNLTRSFFEPPKGFKVTFDITAPPKHLDGLKPKS